MSPRFCFEVWYVNRHRDSFLERRVYYCSFPRREDMPCPAEPRGEAAVGGGGCEIKKQKKQEKAKAQSLGCSIYEKDWMNLGRQA